MSIEPRLGGCVLRSKTRLVENYTAGAPWFAAQTTATRRTFLRDAFCGFGSLALASLLNSETSGATSKNPLAAKLPPREPKAKSVIFLFMAGGPSHLDTFDPKPLLNDLNGQKKPEEFGEAKYQFVRPNARLLGSKRTFRKYGQSGIEVSDLFPHTAPCI